ncbi:hypothetical protein [Leifsonia poae]|uniref:hypothetical protein n=1 Tax=Leifsonia poae TaxID=110933 RepID=UPI001CBEB6E5|nr:hypothetical protein [Leifsonia poae]
MTVQNRPAVAVPRDALRHPRSASAFRTLKILVGSYAGLSVLALVAAFALARVPGAVTDVVIVRGTIVVVSALLMFFFARGTTRGSRGAFLRIRIMSGAMVVAIAVIVSLPGFLPLWMRIEQAVCGLLLIGIVLVVNGKHLRAVFAAA